MSDRLPVYAPILKWKRGEQSAIQALSSATRAKLFPIAELADRPYNWTQEVYSKSWAEHIDDVCAATAKCWGKETEFAVDQPILDEDAAGSEGQSPWSYLFTTLWGLGVNAIPVLSSRASKLEIDELKEVNAQYGRSRWVFRWVLDDEPEAVSPAAVIDWLTSMLVRVEASAGVVDVIIDCAHVSGWSVADRGPVVAAWLDAVLQVVPWRRVFVAFGAFPENLAGIPPGVREIERKDWALYQDVRQRLTHHSGFVGYADYAVSHVAAFDEDPRLLRMSASIRYTHHDKWVVLKGRNVKDFGYGQYLDLCRLLVLQPVFLGASFSEGDSTYALMAAGGAKGPGNATHWRRDATNHHIHVVLSQVASLPGF